MTVSFEVGIVDLVPEFLADALVFLRPLQAAGAVSAGTLQALPDHANHFLIVIQSDSHGITSLPPYYRGLCFKVKYRRTSSTSFAKTKKFSHLK